MADEVRLPEGVEAALGHWTRHHETSTHSIGSECIDCHLAVDIRRAIKAELHLACARGAERTADMTYEQVQAFATKQRAQADALEGE